MDAYANENEDLDVTIGFYEQYGSGMILRAYEERQLGIDNALDGIKKNILLQVNLPQRFNWKTKAPIIDGLV